MPLVATSFFRKGRNRRRSNRMAETLRSDTPNSLESVEPTKLRDLIDRGVNLRSKNRSFAELSQGAYDLMTPQPRRYRSVAILIPNYKSPCQNSLCRVDSDLKNTNRNFSAAIRAQKKIEIHLTKNVNGNQSATVRAGWWFVNFSECLAAIDPRSSSRWRR